MITQAAIAAIRRVVDESTASEDSWQALLETFQHFNPSALWGELPTPDLEHDVANANAWISHEASAKAKSGRGKGLYFGLNTLNMENNSVEWSCMSPPFNVEIGGTGNCVPSDPRLRFAGGDGWWNGENHLIESLRTLKRIYMDDRWPADTRFHYADHGLFLRVFGNRLAGRIGRY